MLPCNVSSCLRRAVRWCGLYGGVTGGRRGAGRGCSRCWAFGMSRTMVMVLFFERVSGVPMLPRSVSVAFQGSVEQGKVSNKGGCYSRGRVKARVEVRRDWGKLARCWGSGQLASSLELGA